MRSLQEAGIIVPEEIPSDDDIVPLDFTRLGNKDLGAIHSRYAVRHSHAIFIAAVKSTRLVRMRRDLRMHQAKFRVLHKGEKKTDVDALMEEDEHISKTLDRIAVAEAEIKLLEAVANGYDDLRNASSREITRRLGEKAALD